MGVKYRSSPSGGILTTTSTTTFTLLLLLLLLLLPLATPASTSKTAFADGYCSSCSVNVWDPGSAEACGTKLLDAVNSCQSTYGAQKCYDAQRKIDQNYDYSMDGGKVCVAQGGCFHVCVDVGVNSYSTAQVQLCCLKPGSNAEKELYTGKLAPNSGPSGGSTSNTEKSKPKEGEGVGISCTLVNAAAKVYKDAKKAGSSSKSTSTTDKGAVDATLSFYAQALHMACLRSSPRCEVAECGEVAEIRKEVPPGCADDDDALRGGEFEEGIFSSLVNSRGFTDFQSRMDKAAATISGLVAQVDAGKAGTPFLNLMLAVRDSSDSMGSIPSKLLVGRYYSTVQVLEGLQPFFDSYITTKISASTASSAASAAQKVTQAHAQLLRCGVAPSYEAKPDSGANAIPPAGAAAASFFIPMLASQLREAAIAKAILKQQSRLGLQGLASQMKARLPKSPDLQPDTRNWFFDTSASQGAGNLTGLAIPGQVFSKDELSDEAASNQQFQIYRDLDSVFHLSIPDRKAPSDSGSSTDLQDVMALAGMFFPTPDGKERTKPFGITIATPDSAASTVINIKLIGPVAVIFPASAPLVPSTFNTAFPASNTTGQSAGGAINPRVPSTAEELASLMYAKATLQIQMDPRHYVDASPKIDPASQLYIVDMVSGKEIPSRYTVVSRGGKDRAGKEMEFGMLEAELEAGKGVWAGGWGGGGAFAVGVKGWTEVGAGGRLEGSRVVAVVVGVLAVWVGLVM